jgi:hypothetical protein
MLGVERLRQRLTGLEWLMADGWRPDRRGGTARLRAVRDGEVADLDSISHEIIQNTVVAWWALEADDPRSTREAMAKVIDLAKSITPNSDPRVVLINDGEVVMDVRDNRLEMVDPLVEQPGDPSS